MERVFPLFKIVGAHPASSGVIEAEVLWALERRVAALERQLREHQEALYASPSFALRELKRQVDSFKNKLEHNDQLSWLSKFYAASYMYHTLPTVLNCLLKILIFRNSTTNIVKKRNGEKERSSWSIFKKEETVCYFLYIYISLSRNVSFFLFFERFKLDDTKLIEKWKLNIRKQR